jgi:hypothetical protein
MTREASKTHQHANPEILLQMDESGTWLAGCLFGLTSIDSKPFPPNPLHSSPISASHANRLPLERGTANRSFLAVG